MRIPSSSLISCIPFALALAAAAREPANLDEAKKCIVFVRAYAEGKQLLGDATGFIMEENGVQWVYTNAHAIEDAKRIEFTDSDGKVLSGFGRFACFAKGSGAATVINAEKKKVNFGEDGVRFELTTKRELAFALAAAPKIGTEVVTLGDNDGDKVLDVLEGTVAAVNGKVVQSTCKTDHGSSGGPLLNKADYKVLALNTWGIPASSKIADMLWRGQKPDDKAAAAATILAGATWLEMKASDFLDSSAIAAKFLNTVRALYLVYLLTPQESGFKIDPDKTVFGTEMTYEEAFRLLGREAVLQPVIALNLKLAGREGGIGINNMQLAKIYAGTLYDVRRSYAAQREALSARLAPYYVSKFRRVGLFAAGDLLSKELAKPQSWFASRTKLGATMPVGKWFNLRPLSDLGEVTVGDD